MYSHTYCCLIPLSIVTLLKLIEPNVSLCFSSFFFFYLLNQVLVRFPTGERKDRRFHSSATIQSLYDYVDSLGCLEVESYSLVSNFPRVVYGQEKLSMSLKDAGLHPQASLFVELNS